MSNSFGNIFCVTTWGESHGKSLGVVIDGCPPGIEISIERIQKELNRRRPGQSEVATPRSETDVVNVQSGIINNISTGMPITLEIFNQDADSSKYEEIKNKWRPDTQIILLMPNTGYGIIGALAELPVEKPWHV